MALRGDLSGLVIQQIVGVSKLRVTAAERRAYGQWSQLFARQQRVVRAAANLGNLQAAFTVGWIPVTTLVLFWMVVSARAGRDRPGHVPGVLRRVRPDPRCEPGHHRRAGGAAADRPAVRAGPADPRRRARGRRRMHRIRVCSPARWRSSTSTSAMRPTGRWSCATCSLEIQPGEFVAVVGPSGSRQVDADPAPARLRDAGRGSGAVRRQGSDTLDIQPVRRQIGVVIQNAQLMPGSILTKVVGATGLTGDDAWLAGVGGSRRRPGGMPMGMRTFVTEGEVHLSGGQSSGC